MLLYSDSWRHHPTHLPGAQNGRDDLSDLDDLDNLDDLDDLDGPAAPDLILDDDLGRRQGQCVRHCRHGCRHYCCMFTFLLCHVYILFIFSAYYFWMACGQVQEGQEKVLPGPQEQ